MASKAIYSAVAVVGIAAASGAAYWYQNKPQGPQEMSGAASVASAPAGTASATGGRGPGGPAGVEVAKVEITRLQDDAQTVGSLRSRQNVMLRPEVAGRVQTIGFSDGARVKKGDVLVQLDDVLQRAEVRQALAQVSIARANLKRNQELVAQNFVAQRVLDEASANVQVVEAQMALACARWERMRVLAPFDGTAGIRNINLGDYVKDGADLVNIEDLSSMYVDFKLPERFQGKLRQSQPVEIQLDAMPGRMFKAKIEAIDPQIDANGRAVSVRAVMPNNGGEPMVQRPATGASGAGGTSASAPLSPASAAMRAAGAVDKPKTKAPAKLTGKTVGTVGGVSASRAVDGTGAACAANNAAARGVAAGVGASGGVRAAGAAVAQAGADGRGGGGAAKAGGGKSGAAAAGAGAPSGAGGPLRPGMFARVTTVFNIKEKSLTVPEEAIVPQGGKQFVIKVVPQTEAQFNALTEAAKVAAASAAASAAAVGTSAPVSNAPPAQPPVFVDGKRLVSQRTEVKLGIRRAGRVELTEGVEEGDTVVVAGQQRLQRDNTPVRVVDLGRPGSGQGGGGQGSAAPAATATAPAATATATAAPTAPSSASK